MTLFILYLIVACIATLYHFRVMRQHRLFFRLLHLLILIGLWSLLTPILFNWAKKRKVQEQEPSEGLVLLDVSSSMHKDNKLHPKLDQHLKSILSQDLAEITLVKFSNGALAPIAQGQVQRGTQLNQALKDIEDLVRRQAPEWIWLISDGGFEVPPSLPEILNSVDKYVSPSPEIELPTDIGILDVETDSVWYTRTETDLRATLTRTGSTDPISVDVLCLINGRQVAVSKAQFKSGELSTQVDFVGMAPHIGRAMIEVVLAEGQGGALRHNDRFFLNRTVLRDQVRILRVVGRPTWNSKFLRDALVRREDIDLVDFHILRSMRDIKDNMFGNGHHLALIPFPVNELFVENLNSFDLIIWQNFDSNSYSFFQPQYLRNMKKFVRDGGGMLFVSGHLPWNYQRGLFSDLVPVRASGRRSFKSKEPIHIKDPYHKILSPDLKTGIQNLPNFEFDMFTGSLNPDSEVILEIEKAPLLSLRDYGQGRVAMLGSDGLWQLEFNQGTGGTGVYQKLLDQTLLWLQHHPDLTPEGFTLSEEGLISTELSLSLLDAKPSSQLIWKQVYGDLEWKSPLEPEKRQMKIQSPPQPGVYKVYRDAVGEKEARLIPIRTLQGEFLPKEKRTASLKRLEQLGFNPIQLHKNPPWKLNPEPKVLERSYDEPWHHEWFFLALLACLIIIHWLIVSSAPRRAIASS